MTYFARIGRKTGGDDEIESIALTGVEFVRCWSLHILPKGYTKTRRYGGYSNRHCNRYISECRDLLIATGLTAIADVAAPSPQSAEQSGDEPAEIDRRAPCCPTCKAKMRSIAAERRRSWIIVMRSNYRPTGYCDG